MNICSAQCQPVAESVISERPLWETWFPF